MASVSTLYAVAASFSTAGALLCDAASRMLDLTNIRESIPSSARRTKALRVLRVPIVDRRSRGLAYLLLIASAASGNIVGRIPWSLGTSLCGEAISKEIHSIRRVPPSAWSPGKKCTKPVPNPASTGSASPPLTERKRASFFCRRTVVHLATKRREVLPIFSSLS